MRQIIEHNMVVETDSRTHNANLDAVEALIDAYSLSYVLDLVAEACSAKADHLVTNWRDDSAGAIWDNNAERILAVAHKARLSIG